MAVTRLAAAAIAAATFSSSAAAQDAGCAPGTRCLATNSGGSLSPDGNFLAQCSGKFPDFIAPRERLAEFSGPWFRLAQDYPATAPVGDAPWASIDYRTPSGADAWLLALRTYAFEGMIPADFRPEDNSVQTWFHMPLMNFGPFAREHMRGVTRERVLVGPELGLKDEVRVENFAVGFYNEAAAATIGRVWVDGARSPVPDLTDPGFAPGAMSFKVLFSAAKPEDFAEEVGDLLAGAPQWTIATSAGPIPVRLLQMDVAAADAASPTGWVFGTFAYDRDADESSPWEKLRPVGLSWGNDEGLTPADVAGGQALAESIISDAIPAYAAGHLGWAGRVNGPVDNPASGCLSCHGTAQYPNVALLPPPACTTDGERLQWFRNLRGNEPFGTTAEGTCMVEIGTPPPTPLDYSLQMRVVLQSVRDFHNENPCGPAELAPGNLEAILPRALPAEAPSEAERVHR